MHCKNILFSLIMLLTSVVQSALTMYSKQQTPTQKRMRQQLQARQAAQKKILLNEELIKYSEQGNIAYVNQFLKIGADVNYKNKDGLTALFFAYTNNHYDIGKILLDHTANANMQLQNKNGFSFTPLHIACQENNLKFIKLLLAYGANVNAEDKRKHTPLHHASASNTAGAAKLLLAASNINHNAMDIDGTTPLHFAAGKGFLDIVNLLIISGANVNTPCIKGQTPLHDACLNGYFEIAKILLKNKADKNSQTLNGWTPLHCAAGQGCSLEIVNLLISNQTDVNAENKDKLTPLHMAILHNHLTVVEALLKSGANVNAQSDAGEPIAVAYYKQNSDIIALLIQYGAHPTSDEQAKKDEQKFFAQINHKENESDKKESIIIETSPTQQDNVTTKNTAKITSLTTELITSTPKAAIKTSDKPLLIKDYTPKIKSITTTTTSSSLSLNKEFQVLQDKNFKWGKFLSKTQQGSIKDHLRQLKHWPDTYGLDIKLLQGQHKGTFRMRVGVCRVIFFVDEKNRQILIPEIGLRKNVYKK